MSKGNAKNQNAHSHAGGNRPEVPPGQVRKAQIMAEKDNPGFNRKKADAALEDGEYLITPGSKRKLVLTDESETVVMTEANVKLQLHALGEGDVVQLPAEWLGQDSATDTESDEVVEGDDTGDSAGLMLGELSVMELLMQGAELASVGTDGEGTDGEGTDGEGTDGEGTDGEGTDGEGTDGEGTDGEGTDGEGTDGEGTDGEGTDGEGTDGEGTDGEGTDGEGTDGEGTDGEGTDGEGTDGEGADGEGTDGEGTDGESTDGEGTDGEDTDGEGTDGEGTDGEGTDGEGTDGEDTDGEANSLDNWVSFFTSTDHNKIEFDVEQGEDESYSLDMKIMTSEGFVKLHDLELDTEMLNALGMDLSEDNGEFELTLHSSNQDESVLLAEQDDSEQVETSTPSYSDAEVAIRLIGFYSAEGVLEFGDIA